MQVCGIYTDNKIYVPTKASLLQHLPINLIRTHQLSRIQVAVGNFNLVESIYTLYTRVHYKEILINIFLYLST